MTGSELGFSQERGWVKEKRGTHRMNVYVTDTGLQAPGTGSYLECDPEGVHYISTPNNVYMMAHELGHLAEMGTYGFINNPKVGWAWEAVSWWFQWYFYKDNPDGIRLYLERHMMPLDDFETRYHTWFFFKYLSERFGGAFVGHMWSTAAQDELPFEVIQRLMGPSTLFANLFCDFASRTVAYDFDTLGAKLRNMNGDSNGRTRMDSVTSLGDGRTFISREDSELCWFGFEVLDVRALLAHVQSSAAEVNDESRRKGQQNVCICVNGIPYPEDWRAMVVHTRLDSQRQWRWWKRIVKFCWLSVQLDGMMMQGSHLLIPSQLSLRLLIGSVRLVR